jgi:hypothetical protein
MKKILEQPKTTHLIRLPFFLFALAMNIFVVTWIQKLDDIQCKCSEDWRTPYIKYWTIFNICLSVTIFLLRTVFSFELPIYMIYLSGIQIILGIMNLIALISYIYKLKKIECECSEDNRREIIYIYQWIIAVLLIFLLLLVGLASLIK